MRNLIGALLAASVLAPMTAEAQRGGFGVEGRAEMRGPGPRDGGGGNREPTPRGDPARPEPSRGFRADRGDGQPGQRPFADRPARAGLTPGSPDDRRAGGYRPDRGPGFAGADGRQDGGRDRNRDWNRPSGDIGAGRGDDRVRRPVDDGRRLDAGRRPGNDPRLNDGGRFGNDGRLGNDRRIDDDRRDWTRSTFDGRGVDRRGGDWRDDRRGGGWNDGRDYRDRGRGGWDRGWHGQSRYDWTRYRDANRAAYRLPRYDAPGGWNGGYRRFGIGISLSNQLWGQNYWISDPYAYRLPEAYGPYRWVRYYDDALLVDLDNGQVVDAVYGIFW